ncbi:uncharacterized protein PFL1_01347 [Pseudozyma flocculosa PF-1]|uniref:Related to DNA-directed RNA polymerase II regulator n=1 Tax=Pseudozyma flocculosa TaxID=84751 RepID=A0A5C3EVS4_9BASI|nr:uncharacterized protein PFL1_01347 [Pseudozyma flocculosa PF-1]EPQ31159.1 hypothetical protein PFL1_01347 [Pseudozyma flocculosa PF-1]SPO36348.1 related to DNA-directed RNA polymerase II regulator [Pseudozyma flocculosa]
MSSSSGSRGIAASSTSTSSSSSSSRKRELIDRVRYPNPIPLPPYAPKLVKVATDPARYANPHFADRLASAHPLPVLVDAHAGMPIDLARFQDLWEGDLSEVSVAPTDRLDQDSLDDADAFLLQDFASALPAAGTAAPNGAIGIVTSLHASDDPASAATLAAALQQRHASAIGPNAKTTLAADDVTWLRRTEYLSAEQKRAQQAVQKPRHVEAVNTSREAQVNKIQQSFRDAQKPLDRLVHPTKRGVTAVSSFELLPDPDTWATDYHVVRFIDPPGRIVNGVPIVDPRLDVALLRPVTVNNEQRVSYYLPTGEDLPDDPDAPMSLLEDIALEDEKSRRLRKRRRTGKFPAAKINGADADADGDGEGEGASRNEVGTAYKWIRDYVPKDTAESSHDVLLLSLDDGVPDEDPDADIDPIKGAKRSRGGPGGAGDDDDDDDLFGGDDDDEDGADGGVQTTAVPQAEHERRKRSRRSELTKGKERDAAPDGTGATLAFKSKPKAYYHKVGMRFTLRVWRSRVAKNEKLRNKDRRYPGKWDVITLSNRDMTEREKLRRYHLRSQVDDMGALDPYESSADEAEDDVDGDEEHEAAPVEAADAAAEGSPNGADDAADESRRIFGDDDEDDDEEAAVAAQQQQAARRDADADADANADAEAEAEADGENEDEDEQTRGGARDNHDDDDDEAGSKSGNDESGRDDDGTDDEDAGSIDGDEELAALQAEAAGAGDSGDVAADEGEGGGRRSRRSRTTASASAAAGDGDGGAEEAGGEEQAADEQTRGEDTGMDVDEE